MGCSPSKDDDGRRINQKIDQQLRMDRQRANREVKCLLLGAGESGKSTILKQMQLIHGVGYTNQDRYAFREVIFSNLVQSIKVIVSAMPALGIPLRNPSLEADVQFVLTLPNQLDHHPLSDKVVGAIARLWRDIADPNYMPSEQDILRSRVKTTGIVETVFHIGELTYRMFDVGGQRSERKKWIHCFENVTAIVFLVAISEYDQVLLEDETVNRMQESLTLFQSICDSRWFTRTSVILFLNKIDLFKEKVLTSPVANFFPDFPGPNTFQDGCHFFLKKFTDLNRSEYKQVYAHFTCATDTTQIKFVMAAVNDIIVQQSLRAAGLML